VKTVVFFSFCFVRLQARCRGFESLRLHFVAFDWLGPVGGFFISGVPRSLGLAGFLGWRRGSIWFWQNTACCRTAHISSPILCAARSSRLAERCSWRLHLARSATLRQGSFGKRRIMAYRDRFRVFKERVELGSSGFRAERLSSRARMH
jgi:hypothetical protein